MLYDCQYATIAFSPPLIFSRLIYACHAFADIFILLLVSHTPLLDYRHAAITRSRELRLTRALLTRGHIIMDRDYMPRSAVRATTLITVARSSYGDAAMLRGAMQCA